MSMIATPKLRNAFLQRELVAVAGSSIIVLVGLLLRVAIMEQDTDSWWPLISLLPWLVISASAMWAVRSSSTLKLGLSAFSCVIPAFVLGPNLILHLSPYNGLAGMYRDMYLEGTIGSNRTFSVQEIVSESQYYLVNFSYVPLGGFFGTLSVILEILGLLLLIASIVWLLVALSPYLLSKAPRTSFGIDTSFLIFAFAIISLFVQSDQWGLLDAFGPNAFFSLITLSWAVPVLVLLALFVRHGGAIAIGAAVGAFVGGWLFSLVDTIIFWINYGTDFVQVTDVASFRLDSMPQYAIIPVVLLVVVTIWWAMTRGVGGNPTLNLSTSASPINGTSVVAFCLAWIPLTAIPALILGHMAFDQIADGADPQRGIGLARWAIFVSYISIASGIVVALNWIR